MKNFGKVLLASMALLSLGACGSSGSSALDRGADYCDCIINNGCWAYDTCPHSSDCYDIYAVQGGSASACLAIYGDCEKANCQEFSEFF